MVKSKIKHQELDLPIYTNEFDEFYDNLSKQAKLSNEKFEEFKSKCNLLIGKYFDAFIEYKNNIDIHNAIVNALNKCGIKHEIGNYKLYDFKTFVNYYDNDYIFDCYTYNNRKNSIERKELGFNPYKKYDDLESHYIYNFSSIKELTEIKQYFQQKHTFKTGLYLKELDEVICDTDLFEWEKEPLVKEIDKKWNNLSEEK